MRLLSPILLLVLLLTPVFAADPVSDDALYDQVRIRIAGDREIGGNKIDVKVQDRVVELTGTVRSEKQKTKAAKVAKKVKGVKSVVNRLVVSP